MARVVDQRTKELQAHSTKLIMAAHIEPKDDMIAERKRATFDVKELSYALNGGKEVLDRRSDVLFTARIPSKTR